MAPGVAAGLERAGVEVLPVSVVGGLAGSRNSWTAHGIRNGFGHRRPSGTETDVRVRHEGIAASPAPGVQVETLNVLHRHQVFFVDGLAVVVHLGLVGETRPVGILLRNGQVPGSTADLLRNPKGLTEQVFRVRVKLPQIINRYISAAPVC